MVTRGKNSLVALLKNDHIYPPVTIPSAFEGAWRKWSEGAPHSELREGLGQLFAWLDLVARNTPRGGHGLY